MSELKANPRFHHPRCQQNTKTAARFGFRAMFTLRFCNSMLKFLHDFSRMFLEFKICMHADTQLNRMSGDVPPPDGRRNRKSNGKAMFGLWRTDVWVMSGRCTWPCAFIHHGGNIPRMITRHKRTVGVEPGIERAVAARVGDLRLSLLSGDFSYLFYLRLCFSRVRRAKYWCDRRGNVSNCQRWIGRRKKVERKMQKKQRGIKQRVRWVECPFL